MILAAFRDLQYRRRRFAIVMLGAAVVLALSLVMSGLSASFSNEIDRTLRITGASSWLVAKDAPGPFTSFAPFPASAVSAVQASLRAGGKADGVIVGRQSVLTAEGPRDTVVIGVTPNGVGAPQGDSLLRNNGEVIVGSALDAKAGDTVSLGSLRLKVVGVRDNASLLAGTPDVFITLRDAQTLFTNGNPLVTAVVTSVGVSTGELPQDLGLKALTVSQTHADAMRPLEKPSQTISMVQALLWMVAALIVGSAVYLNALERTRDFAVFKATGTSTKSIGQGLVIQALILSLVAAVIGAIVATLLAPVFPMHVEIPPYAYLLLLIVAVVVALLASIGGLRRTARVQPALAFGGP